MIKFISKYPLLIYIISSIYFDSRIISINTQITRVRWVQLSVIFILIVLFLKLTYKKDLKFQKFDIMLIIFIILNLLSYFWSVNNFLTLKVSGSLIINFLIYFYVKDKVKILYLNKKLFITFLKLFILFGLLTILFGVYQVFAAFINDTFHSNIWVGIYGVIHQNYAGLSLGRPYAFLQEPDYYGEFSLFFFFFTIFVQNLDFQDFRLKKMAKLLYYSSILGLFFSLVRAALLALVIGLIILIIFKKRIFIERKTIKRFQHILMVTCLILIIGILLVPGKAISKRFTFNESGEGISLNNSRLIQVIYSLNLFYNHPWIGQGTNSFATIGIWGGSEEYYNNLLNNGIINLEDRYDPNILTTVMLDVGVIGLLIFVIILIYYLRLNIKLLKKGYQQHLMFFFPISLLLFITYQFTTAFWAPYFWVILGINIGIVEGIKMTDKRKLIENFNN